MLVVVISQSKSFRKQCIEKVCSASSEKVVIDDTLVSLVDLEQYIYPSLFSEGMPVVQGQFMLESHHAEMTEDFAKKLIASPTVFIFEELDLPAAVTKMLQKFGAVIESFEEKKVTKKTDGDLFGTASAIVVGDKKKRWLDLQCALELFPIEAILGIMYWKVRDQMLKSAGVKKEEYRTLYKALLQAHAQSWQKGVPLPLMIEKVLLS